MLDERLQNASNTNIFEHYYKYLTTYDLHSQLRGKMRMFIDK